MFELQMKEFENYFKKFDIKDENILRKYNHSIRVMEYSIEIAKSLSLSEKMVKIVGISGLLHDIGRFEQWKKYKTYSDLQSIDHGKLGVKILNHNNYIKNYISDEKYINTVLNAVSQHNKYKISDKLSFNDEIVCKIIRDADKLDLLKNQEKIVKPNIIFHKEILENIDNQQCCLNKLQYNEADKIIQQICFIYDINFQYSLSYIEKENILNNKLQLLKNNCPENVNLDEIEQKLTKYLIQMIN